MLLGGANVPATQGGKETQIHKKRHGRISNRVVLRRKPQERTTCTQLRFLVPSRQEVIRSHKEEEMDHLTVYEEESLGVG